MQAGRGARVAGVAALLVASGVGLAFGLPLRGDGHGSPGTGSGTAASASFPAPELAVGDHWDFRDSEDGTLFGYQVIGNNAYILGKDVYTVVARRGGVTEDVHRGNTFYLTVADLNFVSESQGERVLLDFPLEVGASWDLSGVSPFDARATVEAREPVEVEAGTFDALRILVTPTDPEVAGGHVLWYAPQAKFLVKSLAVGAAAGFELASATGLPPASGVPGGLPVTDLPGAGEPRVEVIRRSGTFEAYLYTVNSLPLGEPSRFLEVEGRSRTYTEEVPDGVDAVIVEFVPANGRPLRAADAEFVLTAWPHEEARWLEQDVGRTLRMEFTGDHMESLRAAHLHLELYPRNLAFQEDFTLYVSLFHHSAPEEGYTAVPAE